ncbi:6415_t:CDS:2, partial [Acaulospora colombiana]
FLPPPSFKELKVTSDYIWKSVDAHLRVQEDVDSPHLPSQEQSTNQDHENHEEGSFNTFSQPSFAVDAPKKSQPLTQASEQFSGLYANDIFMDFEEDNDTMKGVERADSEPLDSSQSTASQPNQNQPTILSENPLVLPSQASSEEPSISLDESISFNSVSELSDTSIHRMPTFRIPLHRATALKSMLQGRAPRNADSRKVCTLVGVIDIDGPDMVRIKKGKDAGKEVGLLKIIMADADGSIVRLTIWRSLAQTWDIQYNIESDGSLTCTGSDTLKSKMTVCYRLLPVTREDRKLRPDLRLAELDPG